ncbi:MAG TPA: HD domain-containing protein [Candidatus Saccharimonadales bacterium]|nr:HD domain-containing protein [Candidatus Saccharimonadales bacterium]
MNTQTKRTAILAKNLELLYGKHKKSLLFHGWHHIYFVAKKAVEFANELDVNKEIVEAAALTHDLNYIVDVRAQGPEAGTALRTKYLKEAGFSESEISEINKIVLEEHTAYRHANISDAAKVLSDADSLFKVMPINPVLFSSKFITETKSDLRAWATRIINEQKPLMEQGIYFYTDIAKCKYTAWAETDLELVEQVLEALDDLAGRPFPYTITASIRSFPVIVKWCTNRMCYGRFGSPKYS